MVNAKHLSAVIARNREARARGRDHRTLVDREGTQRQGRRILSPRKGSHHRSLRESAITERSSVGSPPNHPQKSLTTLRTATSVNTSRGIFLCALKLAGGLKDSGGIEVAGKIIEVTG